MTTFRDIFCRFYSSSSRSSSSDVADVVVALSVRTPSSKSRYATYRLLLPPMLPNVYFPILNVT